MSQKIGRFIKQLDIFGVPVSLTFKKDPCIKSVFGGTVTVIVRLGILAYLLYQCANVIQKVSTIQYSIYQRDLRVDETEYILDQELFDFGIQIEYQHLSSESQDFRNNFNPYQYVYLKLNQNNAYFEVNADGNTVQKKKKQEIQLEKCGASRLGTNNATDYLGIANTYLCPKNYDFQLKGNQASKEYKYVQIQLNLCNQTFLNTYMPGQKCASKSEQLRIMQFMKMYLVVQNSYFDTKDFSDNPIKKIMRPYFLYVNANVSQHMYLQVGNHEVTLHDNILYGDPKQTNFIETKMNYVTHETEDDSYSSGLISVDFQIDDTVRVVTRQVNTFLMAFSASGGFMTALLVVGRLLVGMFSDTIYFSTLIGSVYKYETKEAQSPHSTKRKTTTASGCKDKDFRKTEQSELTDGNQDIFLKVLSNIKNRRRLVYGLAEQLRLKLKYICKMRISPKEQMKDSLYKKGLQKIEYELDIRNVAKELRTLKFITRVLLTKHQRYMVPYFNKHLLDSEIKQRKTKQEQNTLLQDYLHKIIVNSGNIDIDKRILKNISKERNENIINVSNQTTNEMKKVAHNQLKRNRKSNKFNSDAPLKSIVEEKDVDLEENINQKKNQKQGLNTIRTLL